MICLGRAGVDLYSVESNLDFLDVKHFRKSVGGSPANIAVALSTLGANVGFIGKVSDDPFGHYVKSFLERKGVNTDGLLFDHSGSKTSLAITEMKPENCGVLFYRERPSDLATSILCCPSITIPNSRSIQIGRFHISSSVMTIFLTSLLLSLNSTISFYVTGYLRLLCFR